MSSLIPGRYIREGKTTPKGEFLKTFIRKI